MRNITDSPAEGDDFFERPRDLRKLQRELEDGAHILFTAPRRVGKTSLILRLCEVCRNEGWSAVFLNVQGCSDELTFAEKLVDELRRENLNPEAVTRVLTALREARRAIGGTKISAFGYDVQIGDVGGAGHSTLGQSLESTFRQINADKKNVVIAIDEMPELLLNLSRQDNGAERVALLLHWLRALRETHRQKIHWIFLGSIGLDSFVDGRNLRKTLTGLTKVSPEDLNVNEADAFLERLGRDNRLPIAPPMRQSIIQRLGWTLPHHLQLVFHALRGLDTATIDETTISQAFESLLRPENRGHFDTWRQRLEEQLSIPDAAAARRILRHVCQHHEGQTRAQILNVLMTARPQADTAEIEEQIGRLLEILQCDYYLLENAGAYAFRSFLLREYWYRREVL